MSASLSAAQASVAEREAEAKALQDSISSTQAELERANKQLEEKDGKVGWGGVGGGGRQAEAGAGGRCAGAGCRGSASSLLQCPQRPHPAPRPQLKEMEEVMRQSQGYSATLQSYNTSLQNDINQEKLKRQELERARDMLQAQVAEMGGSLKSLEQLLQFEKVRAAAAGLAGPRCCCCCCCCCCRCRCRRRRRRRSRRRRRRCRCRCRCRCCCRRCC